MDRDRGLELLLQTLQNPRHFVAAMASGVTRKGAAVAFAAAAAAAEMDCEAAGAYLHHQDAQDGDGEPKQQERHGRQRLARRAPSLGTTVALAVGTLVLIVLVMAGRHPARHSTLLNFFQHTGMYSPEMSVEKYVGIDLHPNDHIHRPPTTIVQNWTITSDYRWPDGVKKRVYLVNGQFPGPTVECRPGDKLIIQVTNALAPGEKSATFADSYALADATEGISIHWHGLQMRGSNHMDGAVGVTQCPLPAGESFTYEFDVGSEAGTFWWHAHSAVYRGDGLYGGLVIHKAAEEADAADTATDLLKYGYEKEILLMVGDWYHKTAEDVLEWYTRYVGLVNEVRSDFSRMIRQGCNVKKNLHTL